MGRKAASPRSLRGAEPGVWLPLPDPRCSASALNQGPPSRLRVPAPVSDLILTPRPRVPGLGRLLFVPLPYHPRPRTAAPSRFVLGNGCKGNPTTTQAAFSASSSSPLSPAQRVVKLAGGCTWLPAGVAPGAKGSRCQGSG
jgi:hypothetical protein